MNNVRRTALVALAALSAPALAYAQAAPNTPVPPNAPNAPTAVAPAPTISPAAPAASSAVPNAEPIDTRTAVKRALAGSPSLAASRLGVDQARQDVLAQEGNYPYFFQADGGHTRSYSPAGEGFRAESRTYTVGTALQRAFHVQFLHRAAFDDRDTRLLGRPVDQDVLLHV